MKEVIRLKEKYEVGGKQVLIAVGVCGNCQAIINISAQVNTEVNTGVLSSECPICNCLTVLWYRSVSIDGD